MSERQNTIVCIFDHASPRITAFQIYEWIHEQLRLPENDVRMIQIEGARWRVYIKFNDFQRTQTIIQDTNGTSEFRHVNGEISTVKIEIAGMGTRRIRIAKLPPETPNSIIRATLSKYGEVKDISEETWSTIYR
jgi:hypothetical protein